MEHNIIDKAPHGANALKNTPEAQSLLRMLNEQNGALMQNVMKAVQCGDYAKAKQLLQPTLQSEDIQDALKKLGQKLG